MQAACERLIPTDELGPGAIACGIPGFIDRQMDTPYGHGALFYSQGPFITDQLPELGYQAALRPGTFCGWALPAAISGAGKPTANLLPGSPA